MARVGGYQAYPQDFYMACAWIAARGSRPKATPSDLEHEPKTYKRRVSGLNVGYDSETGEYLNDFVIMSTGAEMKRKAPAEEDAAPKKEASASATGINTLSIHYGPHTHLSLGLADLLLAEDNIVSQVDQNENALRQLNELLDKAQKECQEMVQGNKRLKLNAQSVQDKNNGFGAVNNTLTRENLKLRTDLEVEKKQNAEFRERQNKIFEEGRKEFATQLEHEKTKAAKVESEREQEKKVAKDLRKKLDIMTAEFVKKAAEIAGNVEKEKRRADEARAKLATIQAVIGRTI
ncbi:uncharacterized protein N0V89_007866 [Didymosphaeria variabile]|uniref:Uncharacterized protein n=1 Tax=Didymosphaeria variabile TaxID=1932322 RepID=A0A9W8XKE5_9PLEO|nr:uncharacterized protein N0V89_007866 [Didymosphaeria variabile]KAJ4352517.1 hypothetical protein N0V89_007866 [Didymosphaeria variabile]